MARRPRLFVPGLFYHVIVRGNQKQKTFLVDQDYQAYLERLAKYRKKYDIVLYAYCLMPNHVHLLLETSGEPLSKFMQGLQQSYTQYFNRAHQRVGHLFQGRYQAIVCEKEAYLLALVRYIHLNPVRAGRARMPEQYEYSGHGVYLKGKATEVLDPAPVLELLGGRGAYRRFVLDGIKEGHKEEYYQVEDQRFLGARGFGEKIKGQAERDKKRIAKKSLGAALKELARELKISPQILMSPDRGWEISRARATVAYTLVRRLGYRVSEVAAYMGRDVATVSSLISRLSNRMESQGQISQKVARLTRIV